ncbi:hypothetical protein F8M41_024750 [Gigaspora margarita]|uniref:Uncharacterized protein n=1 Tax=Gigaspora margarita TaxID=4874 RepID=A0A8H3XJJ9_GIGMA|nr:hypothetical protein F8M41_024750 [Gigaspora margarita]
MSARYLNSTDSFFYLFAFPDQNYECPISNYSEYLIYTKFVDQAGNILDYGGTLITVAVYGLKSQFGWWITFFLDDFFILTFSISPILPVYAIDDFEDILMEVQDKIDKVIESFESIRMQHVVDEALRDFETIAISENEKDDDATYTN